MDCNGKEYVVEPQHFLGLRPRIYSEASKQFQNEEWLTLKTFLCTVYYNYSNYKYIFT
jgi:hypothetical protein